MKTLSITTLGLVAAVAVAPVGLNAQLSGSFVVTPYVALFTPTIDLGTLAAGPAPLVNASIRHQDAAAFGTTASYWMTDRFAVEGGLLYSPSSLRGSVAGIVPGTTSATDKSANVWLTTAKLMVQLLPPDNQFNVRFGIGPALITRSGNAFSASNGKLTGLTDVGAAMSLCTRLSLTDKLGIRVRAEDYVYRTRLGFESSVNAANNYQFEAKTQNDFVFSAGLQFFTNR